MIKGVIAIGARCIRNGEPLSRPSISNRNPRHVWSAQKPQASGSKLGCMY